ncbi:PhzF family phenazine biosynthesis protein [soil metagenome]
MKIPVQIVKAFTTDPKLGNPAGVIFNTFELNTTQMQKIAQQVGISECVFITQNQNAYNLRYFSPTKEMDFCGHATIAAYHAIGLAIPTNASFETRIGDRAIEIRTDGLYTIDMGKLQNQYIIEEIPNIADLIGTTKEDIKMAEVFNVGVPKLLIGLPTLNSLFNLQPNFLEIAEFCQKTGIRGFYPFTQETLLSDSTFHARQFNPWAGISEDPITGVAGAALGAWFGKNCIIEQGHCMNAFGRMFVEVADTVKVGGQAVNFKNISIEI